MSPSPIRSLISTSYWVGCASHEPRAKQNARSLVSLKAAGVNFAVLGEREACTGDGLSCWQRVFVLGDGKSERGDAQRGQAQADRGYLSTLSLQHRQGILQFGGNYEVVHHTQLIDELIAAGKLPAAAHPNKQSNVTFHDPCYLGRHNDVIEPPRQALTSVGVNITEMPRNKRNSFCCGAGGAQFWKEEEHGTARVNITRYEEAKATGADTLAVGCPFCMRMFSDASAEVKDGPQVKDVVEIVAERLNLNS
ncbi:MAG: (Fe-S)-binding protein [Anaerolineae bacterium]